VFNSYRREEFVQMPAKMARSAPRPPFGLAEQPVMRRHLASVCVGLVARP